MKNLFTLILVSFFSITLFAQTDDNKNMKVEMNQEAHYIQGDQALYSYIFNNLKYSDSARAAKVSGEMMVSFWVETDSTLSKISVINDPGYGCAAELKRVLSTIKYVPALVNGVPMRSKVILTVPFRAH